MSPGTRGPSVGLVRRLVTTGAALLAVAVVAVGGGLIPPQTAPFRASQSPLVGRTTTVCTTSPATDATATVSAVAVRKAPGREGVLTGVPVGTTALRLIESAAPQAGRIAPFQGTTDIFIYPGYQFRVTDGLMTNFHLPKSTLLMLVSALMGPEKIREIYGHAVQGGYRFFSYGDASLLIP